MQLAGVPDDLLLAVEDDGELGAAARVPRPVLAGAHEEFGPRLAGQGACGLDRVGPVGRAALAPPAGLLAGAREDDGGVPGLLGQRGGEGGDLLVRGTAVDGQPDRDALLRARVEDQPGLEERQVVRTAPVVAAQRAEQARQQRRAERGLLLGERVDQLDDPALRVVGGEAELVEDVLPDEGVVRRLDVSGAGQRAADAAVQPLPLGQAPARGGLGRVEGRFS
ncbi:hypothetical protein SAVCW2_10570 [Streptomyces avermitilis]|uniref:Uncharacterized protein n=1 Tax=Streptomyces avermitilis TaxID=33903 RepID=A0A499VMW9_STRAX|nr:hypothetical protein SAVMC3_76510 [Streptomyces avermitilis]GDY81858.1 hypothetical protein SAVCW2_10570 [Streptomyces avermitilis]